MRSDNHKIDEYISMVIKQIRCREAHVSISEELREHIMDTRDWYLENGYDEAEAIEKALAKTGEPIPLGEQYDKVHLPEPKWGMRPSLSVSTLFRTPLKTVMMFLLIAIASFALFSRIADYSVTVREMKKVENSYNGVISFNNGVPVTYDKYFIYSNLPKTASFRNRSNMPWLDEYLDGYYYFVPWKKPITLSPELISELSALPGVTADTRYMTGGVIYDIERLNSKISEGYDWGYDYTDRFIIEGTFEGYLESSVEPIFFSLEFSNIKQLAGKEFFDEGESIPLLIQWFMADWGVMHFGQAQIWSVTEFEDGTILRQSMLAPESNSRYFFKSTPYRDAEFADSLVPGTRYIFIGRYVPNTFNFENYEYEVKKNLIRLAEDKPKDWGVYADGDYVVWPIDKVLEYNAGRIAERDWDLLSMTSYMAGKPLMLLGDPDSYDFCQSIMELTDYENIAKMNELVEITKQDSHTFDIVYTSNMAAIPRFNERKMVITSGRMVVPSDNDVCVMSQYIADEYGYQLGDIVTIGLGDRLFEQYAQMGAIAYIPERMWNVVSTVELEIVGFYKDIDSEAARNSDLFMGYSPNTIFVPLSLLPIEVPHDHEIKPGEFSLLVENPVNIEEVLGAVSVSAENLDIKLRVSDGGYAGVKDSINESMKASIITTSLYVLAALVAIVLSVYLYIGRNKKVYAIMRALGTPVSKSRSSLTLPLMVIVAVAIPLGGTIGLMYTFSEMAATLQGFEIEGGSYIADTSVPIMAVVGALIAEIAFIALFTGLFLHRLSKTPPLSLLQENTARMAVDNGQLTVDSFKSKNPSQGKTTTVNYQLSTVNYKGYSKLNQVTHYIFKHMCRTGWRSVIAVSLAFVLSGAVGVIILTKTNYEEMFRQIDVKSSINNISYSNVLALSESDLINEMYLYGRYTVAANDIDISVNLTMTNDINRYLTGEYSIEYADGYSDSVFADDIQGDNAVCVIGSSIAEAYDVNIGDEIMLIDYMAYRGCIESLYNEDFRSLIASIYEGQFDTEEELQLLIERILDEDKENFTVAYKVVGVVYSNNSDSSDIIITPPGKAAEKLHTVDGAERSLSKLPVSYTETILSDNESVDEINEYLAELVSISTNELGNAASYFTDVQELDNIRRVRDLLGTLFPIAVAAAVLIGAVAPVLIIIQSAKEAAILRVLGTTKKRVRCMLAAEQVILCVFGLIVAGVGLVLYNSGLFIQSTGVLVLYVGLYLFGSVCASFGAAISVTKNKVLELLQIKE
ncbi:MAG: permease prefix domain 1-containing protein [Oscillospiraceae bacterium]|nr:permease prefix domain 1-containing protein [Oscillospiraceae bacterium]